MLSRTSTGNFVYVPPAQSGWQLLTLWMAVPSAAAAVHELQLMDPKKSLLVAHPKKIMVGRMPEPPAGCVSHGGAAGKADRSVEVVVVVEEVATEGAFVVVAVGGRGRCGPATRCVGEEQPANNPEITRAGTIDHCLCTRRISAVVATPQ